MFSGYITLVVIFSSNIYMKPMDSSVRCEQEKTAIMEQAAKAGVTELKTAFCMKSG